MNTKMAFVIGALVLLVMVPTAGLAWNHLNYPKSTGPKIIWERTGGFIGLDEKLTITADGSVSYQSNHFGSAETDINKTDFEDLLSKAEFFTMDRSYAAKTNAADYFVYKLTVETTSGIKTIKWVDAGASEETLPPELLELQDCLLSIIEGIRQNAQT